MAANATRFCFRTVRTKPLRVSVSLEDAGCCAECLNNADIVRGASVELHRCQHCPEMGRRSALGRSRSSDRVIDTAFER